MNPSGFANLISWVLRLSSAGVLLQTLFFKFTASPESVYIFTKVGAEPWGRIGTGVIELVAAILLIVPATAAYGAILALGVMAGAIASHLTVLGIEVMGDGGLLFGLGLFVFFSSLAIITIHRAQLPVVGERFAANHATASTGARR